METGEEAMNVLKTFYKKFTKAEEVFLGLLLVAITVLVFGSAIARAMKAPIIWAMDLCTFFFAWEVFVGGDFLVRNSSLVGVELIANHLPSKVQKALKLLWFLMIIGFCVILARYGVELCLSNTKRTFQSMKFSYSWCTLSVPVGSVLMLISSLIRMNEVWHTPADYWKQAGKKSKEAAQ
jgi:TRAP-type C4-dicarboxylate transport system permease small subunit